MDWHSNRPVFFKQDKRIFSYEKGESVIVRKTVEDEKCQKWTAEGDEGWDWWFRQDAFRKDGAYKPGIGAILAARYPDDEGDRDWDGQISGHNPQLLQHLPFSNDTFDKIISKFFLHGSIVKAINRPAPHFSRINLKMGSPPEPAIVYVCRSSSAWPGDMALTATHFPSTGFTHAVFLGCEFGNQNGQGIRAVGLESGDRIAGLLSNSEDTVAHPMLLPGIFAELELRRHLNIVDDALALLLNTVGDLSAGKGGADYRVLAPDEGNEDDHAIKPWLGVHVIKIGLENWVRQLQKMLQHVDELTETIHQRAPPGSAPTEGTLNAATSQLSTAADVAAFEASEELKASQRRTGGRIKERLEEIISQYHEKISESAMTMEGLMLATQQAQTRANMVLALETKKDGGQMKSIALLTMIFLPGTFFATFFSMSFFKWDPADGDLVSSWIWIYVVVTVVFTGLTLLLYSWWSRRQIATLGDPEQAQATEAKGDVELSSLDARSPQRGQ